MNYKWQLRKGGRKERCPKCGQLRFVPFVLSADNETRAGAGYGRCDREQSCGYFLYPGKEVQGDDTFVRIDAVKTLPPFEVSLTDVERAYNAPEKRNKLRIFFIRSLGWEYTQRVARSFDEYHVLTTWAGGCVFLQYNGKAVRAGKVINYDENGHRLKDGSGAKWIHRFPQFEKWAAGTQLQQCFFGEHLAEQFKELPIYIVESEKTAVIMHALYQGRVWLACGGSQMLKGKISFDVLKGREVTLIPDEGQFWNWKRTADKYGWKCINICDYYKDVEPGDDVLDCVLRLKKAEK